MTRSRVTSTVILIVGLASLFFYLRGRPTDNASPRPQATGPQELVATVRSEPRSFNRLVARDRTSNLVSLLLHGKLVRINLETQEVEPALAERWSSSADGRIWTLALRRGVAFSDGQPFTSADVLFSLEAAYDPKVASPLADSLMIDGQPLEVAAPDDHSVVITFPAPFGPGVRLLDNLVVLPRHKLRQALTAGTLREAWGLAANPADMAGLGPFVLREYRPGDRLVFARNPHYWRKDDTGRQLPYLDRLVLEIVPDQNAEMLRLEGGQADLTTGEVRPDDLAAIRKAAADGRLALHDLGVGLDPDFLWFNLTDAFGRSHPQKSWMQQREFRSAVSLAVDREAFANTVYLGGGIPVSGPVTTGNRAWHDPSIPLVPHDPARARALLAEVGLRDRDGNGVLDTPGGAPAGFALLTQKGNTLRERSAAFIQEDLRKVGLVVDVVTLEQPAVIERLTKGDYEAIYFGTQASDTDPAMNLDFWRSSGAFHAWNPGQSVPATPWERRIDELMQAQVRSQDPSERVRLFGDVQRLFAQEQPAIYFVAPRIAIATSRRVVGARPALIHPMVLWSADTLSVAPVPSP